MDLLQWIDIFQDAYKEFSVMFSPEAKKHLLSELSENDQLQIEAVSETYELMTKYFFKMVTLGDTFGPINRIKEYYGKSLEANYRLRKGSFINFAKTYWTFKLEMSDLLPENRMITLTQILLQIESEIASVFFPTPGPISIPSSDRKQTQRDILREFAPDMDIEGFLKESPILRR